MSGLKYSAPRGGYAFAKRIATTTKHAISLRRNSHRANLHILANRLRSSVSRVESSYSLSGRCRLLSLLGLFLSKYSERDGVPCRPLSPEFSECSDLFVSELTAASKSISDSLWHLAHELRSSFRNGRQNTSFAFSLSKLAFLALLKFI